MNSISYGSAANGTGWLIFPNAANSTRFLCIVAGRGMNTSWKSLMAITCQLLWCIGAKRSLSVCLLFKPKRSNDRLPGMTARH